MLTIFDNICFLFNAAWIQEMNIILVSLCMGFTTCGLHVLMPISWILLILEDNSLFKKWKNWSIYIVVLMMLLYLKIH